MRIPHTILNLVQDIQCRTRVIMYRLRLVYKILEDMYRSMPFTRR